jgi:hypothetical protein
MNLQGRGYQPLLYRSLSEDFVRMIPFRSQGLTILKTVTLSEKRQESGSVLENNNSSSSEKFLIPLPQYDSISGTEQWC